MKIATEMEFEERAIARIIAGPRSINPAHLREGMHIIGGPTVKTVGPGCTPETVHINTMHCYDTRVDVQVKP